MRPEAEALDPRLVMDAGGAGLSGSVGQILQPYLAQGDFPGITVAVVTDGRVTLEQGYGVSNVKTGSPVQTDTRYDIGSVTKTFTALGVMLLYQQSQGTSHPLNLDAPISQYLRNTGSFKLPRKWDQITTRELLAMTSGIMDMGQPQTWEQEAQMSAAYPLLYQPGTKSSYSDVNYDLLGELIEQWTGEKYGTFIQNEFLTPLGMSQTQELGHSPTVSNQAVGYNESRNGRWPKAAVLNGPQMYAAAGMVSTAQDMAKYMTALLSGQFLDSATYNLMWTSTPTPALGSKPPSDAVRGLGWDNAFDSSTGPVEVTKSGDVPGFTSQLVLYPSTDSGVFISFDSAYHGGKADSGAIAYQIAQSIYQASQAASSAGG